MGTTVRGWGQVAFGKFVMIHTTLWSLQTEPLCCDVVNAEVSEFASSFTWLVSGAEAKCHPAHTRKVVLVLKDVLRASPRG